MARRRRTRPVKLFVGVLATDPDLLGRVRQLLEREFGRVDGAGPPAASEDAASPELAGTIRQFLHFDSLVDPGRLPEARRLVEAIEQRLSEDWAAMEGMGPVWLQPGYLTASKVVVADGK